jgi:hypothetical protein
MNRRSFLTSCIATVAAPAIVRYSSLMPISFMKLNLDISDFHTMHELTLEKYYYLQIHGHDCLVKDSGNGLLSVMRLS